MYALSVIRSYIQKVGDFIPGTSSVLWMVAELVVDVFLVKKGYETLTKKKKSSKKNIKNKKENLKNGK